MRNTKQENLQKLREYVACKGHLPTEHGPNANKQISKFWYAVSAKNHNRYAAEIVNEFYNVMTYKEYDICCKLKEYYLILTSIDYCSKNYKNKKLTVLETIFYHASINYTKDGIPSHRRQEINSVLNKIFDIVLKNERREKERREEFIKAKEKKKRLDNELLELKNKNTLVKITNRDNEFEKVMHYCYNILPGHRPRHDSKIVSREEIEIWNMFRNIIVYDNYKDILTAIPTYNQYKFKKFLNDFDNFVILNNKWPSSVSSDEHEASLCRRFNHLNTPSSSTYNPEVADSLMIKHQKQYKKFISNKNHSKSSILWMEEQMRLYGIHIQHSKNGGEFKIEGVGSVDGYCKETNTIYEYHGCIYHGCIICFNANEYSRPFLQDKGTAGQLYQKTKNKDDKIIEMSYNLVIIWEHEWLEQHKINK